MNRLYRIVVLVASVAVIVTVPACKKDKYTLTFSHFLHTVKNEISCMECHGDMEEGKFVRAGHDVCTGCHEELIEAEEMDRNTCGVCHREKNLDEIGEGPKPSGITSKTFIHTETLRKEGLCEECHESIIKEGQDHIPVMSHHDLFEIMRRAHDGGKSCDMCHMDMDPEVSPSDHSAGWLRLHGSRSGQDGVACSACHVGEESCRECHKETTPSSHNDLWRLKTHGFNAVMERQKCAVCHEDDSCEACHAETRPRSHNAAWRNTHCLGCHGSSAEGTGCVMCHQGGLEAHPNPHSAGWERTHCDSCHLDSYEADECSVCHMGGAEAHPNPHGAGWLSRHCDSCHLNTPEGEQCVACHQGVNLENHSNPHGAGWSSSHCDSCHLGTFEGQQCIACHPGVGSIEAHPNPHSSAWLSTHCNSCHVGTPEGEQCAACHPGGGGVDTHPDPHGASWSSSHCYRCHPGTIEAEQCAACHVGGSRVQTHSGTWPGSHTGYNDATDCSACH